MELIISLIAGAIGGNVAGGLLNRMSLGTIGNSIAGILGGGIGIYILSMLGAESLARIAGGSEIGEIGALMGPFVMGGLGGAIILVIVGTLWRMVTR